MATQPKPVDVLPRVRAKFRISQIARVQASRPVTVDGKQTWESCEAVKVDMYPVGGNQGEDSIFGAATPSGSLSMTIIADEAARVFTESRLGDSFYADFTPAR